MDPHFNEYLAAIAGMHEVYGERPEDNPTEFHDEVRAVGANESAAAAA